MIVTNLWAKELKAGDVIIAADLVDSKYGKINRFTVNRPDVETEERILKLVSEIAKGLS